MERGLYEQLITVGLQGRLAAIDADEARTRQVDAGDQPHVLARHIETAAQRVLAATRDPERRLAIVNALLGALEAASDPVTKPASQLLAVLGSAVPGATAPEDVRPATPLSDAALLTNAHGEPSLGSELRAEIDTSDEVDLLCAFVKWHGLRVLEPELQRLTRRAAPRCESSRRRTWAPPSARRWTGWCASSAPRSRSSTTRSAPGCTPRLAVPARHRLRHRVRRLVEPVPCCAARRGGVERPAVPGRHAGAAGEVRGHLRHLLERRELRDLRPRPGPGPAGRRAGRGLGPDGSTTG